MIIRLKDGSEKEYAQPMSVIDIAKDISEGLARNACAGQVDGKVVDLRTVVSEDCDLNILTFNDDEGKLAFRHTASHVMAQAVKRLHPEAKITIGPAIEDGFYYDFDMKPMTREDLDAIEKEMKKVISSWHVGVAAEAIAAAQFARCGYDVSVQYGANQPEYDLISVHGDQILKISV